MAIFWTNGQEPSNMKLSTLVAWSIVVGFAVAGIIAFGF
jgi:uncharacterized membrane protein YciS (DUF1049 family)